MLFLFFAILVILAISANIVILGFLLIHDLLASILVPVTLAIIVILNVPAIIVILVIINIRAIIAILAILISLVILCHY